MIRVAIAALWPVLPPLIVLMILERTAVGQTGPFLRSSVVCYSNSNSSNVTAWSGSDDCASRETVIGYAQRLEGPMQGIKVACRALLLPYMGAAADFYGRKRMIVVGLNGLTLAFLFVYAASVASASDAEPSDNSNAPQWQWFYWLVVVGFAIQGATTAFGVWYQALVADISEQLFVRQQGQQGQQGLDARQRQRGAFMTVYLVAGHFASMVGALVDLACQRQQWHRYTGLWMSLTATCLALSLYVGHTMKETLAANTTVKATNSSGGDDASRRSSSRSQGPSWKETLALLRRSPFLQALVPGLILVVAGIVGVVSILSSFTMSVYGWAQGELQAYGAWLGIPATASLVCADRIMSSLQGGPASAVSASLTMVGIFLALMALAPFSSRIMLLACTVGVCAAFGYPALVTVVTSRFDSSDQGKVSSVCAVSGHAAAVVALPLFAFLYDAKAHGWAASVPFCISAVLGLAGAAMVTRALSNEAQTRLYTSVSLSLSSEADDRRVSCSTGSDSGSVAEQKKEIPREDSEEIELTQWEGIPKEAE